LAELEIDVDGNIDGMYSRDFIGLDFNAINYKSKKDLKELNKYYSENEFEDFLNLKIEGIEFDFDAEEILAREKMQISAKSFGEKLGDYLSIPIKFIDLDIPKFKKTKKRKYNIEFLRSQKQESFVKIKLPNNTGFVIEDKLINYESEFGKYSCEYSIENNVLEIKRSFELFKGNYNVNKYNDLRSFFNKIRKQESSSINLINKT